MYKSPSPSPTSFVSSARDKCWQPVPRRNSPPLITTTSSNSSRASRTAPLPSTTQPHPPSTPGSNNQRCSNEPYLPSAFHARTLGHNHAVWLGCLLPAAVCHTHAQRHCVLALSP